MAKKKQVFVENGVEYDPYSVNKSSRIPNIVKAIFLKYWFAGAAFFFFGWGINVISQDQLDTTLIVGLGLGLFTDLLLNKIFTMMESDLLEYHPYMMFCSKKWYSFLINIVYAVLLSFLIAYTYHFLNVAIMNAKGLTPDDKLPLGVEPLLFGVFFLVYDCTFLGIKFALKKLLKKTKLGEQNEALSSDTPD